MSENKNIKQQAAVPAGWKWGLAFFVGLFLLVMWAQSSGMPTAIVCILLTALVEFFIFVWVFLKIYRWSGSRMEKWALSGLPLDRLVLSVSKFLMGVSVFVLLQIPFLFFFTQMVMFIKSVAN